MPPTDRFVPRFAAEPPQEALPYGRWAETLRAEFLTACLALDGGEEELGDPGDIAWFPDRTYAGRTYVPATCRTSTGLELFGYVSYARDAGGHPDDFVASADFTDETADRHPEWQLDVADEEIGHWRGEAGKVARITLVWGTPLVKGGAIATGELARLAVDQCELKEGRFTLIAPDDYRGDELEVKLYDVKGNQLASESLYVEEDE